MNNWIERPISDFFEFTIPGDWGRPATGEKAIPVLRSTNFQNDGKIDFSDIALRDVDVSRLEKRIIKRGDVLIEKSGGSTDQPAGRVVYCDSDFGGTCSNFIELGRVKHGLDSKFVFYLLFQLYRSGLVLKYQQQTTGIINFKLNEYKREKVHIPEMEIEQSRIAAVLSCIDDAIGHTEKLIAKQRRIKTGLMHDILTRGIDERGRIRSEATHEFKDSLLGRIPKEWEVLPLSQIAQLQVGYAFKSALFSEGGVRLLRGENVGYGKPDWKDTRYLPERLIEGFSDYILREGDLVIGMDRTFTKSGVKISKLENQDVPSLLVQRVGRFQACLCDSSFLTFLVTQNEYLFALRNKEKGMDIPHLSKTEILSPLVRVPSRMEQKRIAKRGRIMNESIRSSHNDLRKLVRLKTGLMMDLLIGRVPIEPLTTMWGG